MGGSGLERRHHDKARAVIRQQRLDVCCMADESRLHGTEQHEKLGDVLEET